MRWKRTTSCGGSAPHHVVEAHHTMWCGKRTTPCGAGSALHHVVREAHHTMWFGLERTTACGLVLTSCSHTHANILFTHTRKHTHTHTGTSINIPQTHIRKYYAALCRPCCFVDDGSVCSLFAGRLGGKIGVCFDAFDAVHVGFRLG